MKDTYTVYMVRCSDTTLYTGITTNLERRLQEHNVGARGAKYTKSRRPVVLVYHEDCEDRSEAQKREYMVRKLSRREKLSLIAQKVKSL